MAFYSIGSTCLPKFGLDDFVGKTHTYFYDWLITDLDSLDKSLINFSEDLFFQQGIEVCDDDLRVKDSYTGLRFQHDFPTLSDHKIDRDQVAATIEEVKLKYVRRRKRFLESVFADEDACLIRFENAIGDGSSEFEQRYESKLRNIIDQGIRKNINILILSRNLGQVKKVGQSLIAPIETEQERPWRPTKDSWNYVVSLASNN